ncbi:MAG: thiamine pyrophosphate-binding protein [Caldilineaceae bacterium]
MTPAGLSASSTAARAGRGLYGAGLCALHGQVGAFSVVPGPGFLNACAALATAYSNNAKVLCLTGQIPSANIGKGIGMLHEIPDQSTIMQTLTKWAARLTTPADAPILVSEAFRQMQSRPTATVGLEAPMDVLAAKAAVDLAVVEHDIRHPLVDPGPLRQPPNCWATHRIRSYS